MQQNEYVTGYLSLDILKAPKLQLIYYDGRDGDLTIDNLSSIDYDIIAESTSYDLTKDNISNYTFDKISKVFNYAIYLASDGSKLGYTYLKKSIDISYVNSSIIEVNFSVVDSGTKDLSLSFQITTSKSPIGRGININESNKGISYDNLFDLSTNKIPLFSSNYTQLMKNSYSVSYKNSQGILPYIELPSNSLFHNIMNAPCGYYFDGGVLNIVNLLTSEVTKKSVPNSGITIFGDGFISNNILFSWSQNYLSDKGLELNTEYSYISDKYTGRLYWIKQTYESPTFIMDREMDPSLRSLLEQLDLDLLPTKVDISIDSVSGLVVTFVNGSDYYSLSPYGIFNGIVELYSDNISLFINDEEMYFNQFNKDYNGCIEWMDNSFVEKSELTSINTFDLLNFRNHLEVPDFDIYELHSQNGIVLAKESETSNYITI